MAAMAKTEASAFFWATAELLMSRPDVNEGTLMGFPCLRVDGAFFATRDHRSGDLIVKLSRDRVQDVIVQGEGEPFAPAGRVFKEWVSVSRRDAEHWRQLRDEVLRFVSS